MHARERSDIVEVGHAPIIARDLKLPSGFSEFRSAASIDRLLRAFRRP